MNEGVTPSGFTYNTTMSFYNHSIPSGLKGKGLLKKMIITLKGERNIETDVKQIKHPRGGILRPVTFEKF